MSILNILNELAATSSTKQKQAILEEHKSNSLLVAVIRHALDDVSFSYYIKSVDRPVNVGSNSLDGFIEFFLPLLYNRKITGNEARDELRVALAHLSEDDQEVAIRIIERDLKCGVAKTLANKVWKGIAPKFPCMLAQPCKDKTLAKIKYPAYAQLKSDGARAMAVINNGSVEFFSRNGKQYRGLTDLTESFEKVGFGDFVFDGELVVVDEDGAVQPREFGNGIINKATKGTISDEEQAKVVFQVWDIIARDKFYGGKDEEDYASRLSSLEDAVVVKIAADNVQMIETDIVNNESEARLIYNRYVQEGLEGILLKNMDSPWVDKRSPDLVKFKEVLDADVEIVELVEGTGKASGMMGAMTIKTACGVVQCNVGTGFSDAQRKDYWERKEQLVGSIVEIKYNALVADKRTGQKSFFLPVFVELRFDKDRANDYAELV